MYNEELELLIAQIVFYNQKLLGYNFFDEYDFFSKEKIFIKKMINIYHNGGIINDKTIGKVYDIPEEDDVNKFEDYVITLKNLSLERKLQKFGEYYNKIVLDKKYDAKTKVDKAISKLTSYIMTKEKTDNYMISNMIDTYIDGLLDDSEPKVLQTGIKLLDTELGGGIRTNDFIILAGDPGNYKTTVALNIALNVARRNEPVMFFSYEMGKDELNEKLVSMIAEVNTNVLKNKQIKEGKGYKKLNTNEVIVESIRKAGEELKELPIYICTKGETLHDIKIHALKVKPSLIIIDYIQIMPDIGQDQVTATALLSRELKRMTNEAMLNCPIIGLSQFSKQKQDNFDTKRTLNDLKNSSSLRQDANIGLITTAKVYMKNTANERHEVEIDVAKNRSGKAGRCAKMEIVPKWGKIINNAK